MNTFITRVELHNASEADYIRLHAEMEAEKFYRQMFSLGVKYQLPTAEYISQSPTLGPEGVKMLAKKAANKTGRTSWVLTVQSAGMAHDLPAVR